MKLIDRLIRTVTKAPAPDPDPYGIEAALAERRNLRLAGWERRTRK